MDPTPNAQQPATPRMLRTLSGSVKSLQSDVVDRNESHLRTPSVSLRPADPRADQKGLLPPARFSLPHQRLQGQPLDPAPSQAHSTPLKQPAPAPGAHNQHQGHPQQQFHRKSIGDWDFVKTIGAGSMGKVKLAQHNLTGEICAVKIVPRAAKLYQRAHANDPPILNAQAAAQQQKEFEKEVARDKRTIREGALGRLLFHPFICRLYEIVPMTNHYYMLFEYVEGGQMLDYIVSHGLLKEKYARKFARGIALALDYCHKNNVVHRDLKIENIMINQKGDIKIIDFGLSNLYLPKTLLKTYCGSLYFAAPELLSAKPYVGPEVDVWSFGIVLYVLVCGKVPFDDQVVAVLHEKIKRGDVEYPPFLSKECVSLLSRMLVVDPARRAPLSEVILHPWMNKGYDVPVPLYVPKRVPLTLPLDPETIKTIASFDLGSAQSVADELTAILTSVEYQMSLENWYKVIQLGRTYSQAPNSHLLPDPTSGFHPLVSIYYLVEEMKKRRRAKEEALRAHAAQTALLRPEKQAERPVQTPEPAHQQVQTTPKQPVPQLPFPEQAHTSTSPATLTRNSQSPPVLPETPQIQLQQQQAHSPRPSGASEASEGQKGLGINLLLRRLSAKKPKNPSSPARNSPNSLENNVAPPLPKVAVMAPLLPQGLPRKDPMVRRGVSMKVTAKEKSTSSRVNLVAENGSPTKQRLPKPEPEPVPTKNHGRSSSTSTNKFQGFVPVEYLPPLPNITTQLAPKEAAPVPVTARKMHPTARAKLVGGHVRRDSHQQRSQAPRPPLPNTLVSQNSDEGVNDSTSRREEAFFDDVTLDDVSVSVPEGPMLTEEQIIEQFHRAKPNSMPSIEYPRTLFLKGFFSVQTTSTKPLAVIRYNIIHVLSRLGVKFQEVKGGFVCVHTPAPAPINRTDSTVVELEKDAPRAELAEERRLYGDAFRSASLSIDYEQQPPRIRTPEASEGHKSLSRQPSLQLNSQLLLPSLASSSNKSSGHKASNSTGGHRRKFSIGQSILSLYRKKNGSGLMMPPNTPAAAKVRMLYPDEDLDDDEIEELAKQFTDDDSVDSLNGVVIGGGSDMLISSRLEHKARHQHLPNTSMSNEEAAVGSTSRRLPLKFEIHVVKVPLVGLYGVQFKKVLGNTWNYKTLAGQLLNELNL